MLEFGLGIVVGGVGSYWKFHQDNLSIEISELCSDIVSLSALAERYWSINMNAVERKLLAVQILSQVKSLSKKLKSLKDRFRIFKGNFKDVFIQFKKAVSDGDFQSSNMTLDTSRISRIEATKTELIDQVKRGKKLI